MLREIFTIAKWELLKSRSTLSLKSIAIAIGLLILLIAASLSTSESGIQMDDDLYSVAVTNSRFIPVLEIDNRFDAIVTDEKEGRILYNSGTVDLWIKGETIYYPGAGVIRPLPGFRCFLVIIF